MDTNSCSFSFVLTNAFCLLSSSDTVYHLLVQQSALISYGKGINLDIWPHSWVFCHAAICDRQTSQCQGEVFSTTSVSLTVLANGGWYLQFKIVVFWVLKIICLICLLIAILVFSSFFLFVHWCSTTISSIQDKQWNFSFTLVWNTVVWLVLVNFFVKIVTSTAQEYLRNQQDIEMELITDSSPPSHSKTNK